jgi:LysM repeat protein
MRFSTNVKIFISLLFIQLFCTYGQEPTEYIHHIVKRGENVYRLSLRYKVPVDSIKKWNYLDRNYLIIEKMLLIIRNIQPNALAKNNVQKESDNKSRRILSAKNERGYHIVKDKENVFRLSLRYHVPIDSLVIWNKLNSSFLIKVGQQLVVTGPRPGTISEELNPETEFTASADRVSAETQLTGKKHYSASSSSDDIIYRENSIFLSCGNVCHSAQNNSDDTLSPKSGFFQVPDTLKKPEQTPAKDSVIIADQPPFLPIYTDLPEKEIKSTFYEKVLYYYHKSNYLFRIILFLNFFFLLSVVILSIVLLYRRLLDGYIKYMRNKCQDRYRDFITGWLYEEHKDSVPESLKRELKNRVYRNVFTSDLLSLHANLTGESAERLIELYHLAGLKKYSVMKVRNSLWHVKATGFRELAQMKVQEGSSLIYSYLDSDNEILRIEAQSAWIQLNQKDPLNFYNESNAQLTEWGQLNLLHSLKKGGTIPDFGRWLKSDSRSIALFALKMSGIFKQLDNVDLVTKRLDDADPDIRHEAICTLGKMAMTSPVNKLQQMLANEGLVNKTEIVRTLIFISDSSNAPFFERVLLNETDIQLRILAAKGMILLGESGSERLDSLFTDGDPRLKEIIIHAKDNRI